MSDGTGTTTYAYDALYRLTGITNGANQTVGYAYDAAGNRTRLTYPNDKQVTYIYDAGNRLATVTDWRNGQYQYHYDPANRPIQVDGQSYTFDDNGNLLATGQMTNTWDAANRLIQTQRNGATLQPIYNGVNDRVGRTAGLTTTYFALDVQGLPGAIYCSGSGGCKRGPVSLTRMRVTHFTQS